MVCARQRAGSARLAVHVNVALSAWSFGARCEQRAAHLAGSVCSMYWWQQSRWSATSVTKECNAGRRARALVADGSEGVAWESSFHGSGARFTHFSEGCLLLFWLSVTGHRGPCVCRRVRRGTPPQSVNSHLVHAVNSLGCGDASFH